MENKYKATDLVSVEYLPLLVKYNQSGHGKTGCRWADTATALISQRIPGIKSVLDYGCGQGTLGKAVKERISGFSFNEYDPAVIGKSSLPVNTYDLVICTDVLEHVEPSKLDNVLDHIEEITEKIAFFVVATRLAILTLADGRNAHLIVKPGAWWLEKIHNAFSDSPITMDNSNRGQLTFLVEKWKRTSKVLS